MIYLNIETLTGENFGMNFKERNINIDLTFRCSLECPKCLRQAIRKIGFKVPKEPGLGIEIDEDVIGKYPYNEKKLHLQVSNEIID